MARAKSSSFAKNRTATAKRRSLVNRFFGWRHAKPAVFVVVFAIVGVVTVLVSLAAVPKGQIKGKASGKCIDNFYNRQADTNLISIYPCTSNNPAQTWTMAEDGTIRTDGNFCLDVAFARVEPKSKVWLWHCTNDGNPAQKWEVQADGTIKNPVSNLCLEVRYGKTATQSRLWINTCNGNGSQLWQVPTVAPIPVASTPSAPAPTEPAPTPEPTPEVGNTGLALPTCSALGPKVALTAFGGSFYSDQGSATGKAISGDLILDSSAATYKTSNFSVTGKVKNELSGGSLTVEDFLVKASSYDGDWGLGHHNVTARRFRVENHSDGIRLAGTGNSLYEDFCITGISKDGDHSDGIQSYGAQNSNITLRRGIITMPSSNATAGVFAADGVTGSITIDSVLFIGGPYGIRINSDGGGPIAMRNVRFRKGSFGAAPFSIAPNIRITEWTNVAYEDGEVIPPPHAVQP